MDQSVENQNPVVPGPQKVNRTWIIVAVVVVLCCCLTVVALAAGLIIMRSSGSPSPIIGGSYNGMADSLLKSDTLNTIAQYETSQSGCTDVSLFSGTVVLPPDPSADGSWQEAWQVDVCGESHLYSVSFTPSPAGGTDFSIERIDQ